MVSAEYVPAGGGSPAPLPILKAQLAKAVADTLDVTLSVAEQIAAPVAEKMATAWAMGRTDLSSELQWQLTAAAEIANKRLSAQKRRALLGIVQSAFGVVNYALAGGLGGLLGSLGGLVGSTEKVR